MYLCNHKITFVEKHCLIVNASNTSKLKKFSIEISVIFLVGQKRLKVHCLNVNFKIMPS